MNTLFVVIIEDSHVDVKVVLFRGRESAIAYAETYVAENQRGSYDWREAYGPDWQQPKLWLYFWVYTCEGDCIRVEEIDIND